jgi:hypothetical protein
MKKSRFWKVFAVVTAAVLVCILAFFAFFYDYMKNYELSQPISGAEAFMKTVTEGDISDAIAEAAGKNELPYEKTEDVLLSLMLKAGTASEITCRKDFESSTATSPAFIISAGELPLYRVNLEEGEAVRYGFTSWKVAKTEMILSALDAADKTSVYVPAGATLFVNGAEITAPSKGTSPYKYTSRWEEKNPLIAERYVIPTLTDAIFTCTIGDAECEMTTAEDDVYFLYPASLLGEYTIEAPSAAKVYANGIELTADDVIESNIPYELSPIEADRTEAPTMTLYRIKGLAKAPVITAEMYEESLTLWREDNTFYVNYPKSRLYSLEITAPAGSTVTVGGVALTPDLISYNEHESESLFSYTTAPAYDVYELEDLFFAPEAVEIIYAGSTIPAAENISENKYSYSALYPTADDTRAEEVTLDFLKAYFHYTSQGYLNTHENLLTVLEFIPQGCPLYTKMLQSENGFSWTSPVASMKYNTLDVKSVRSYPGSLTLVTVAFDLSQTFWGAEGREYRGDIMILLNADYRVVGLEIKAEK